MTFLRRGIAIAFTVTLSLFGIWLYENEFTVIFHDGVRYSIGKPPSERRSVKVSQIDLKIVTAASKLVANSASWSRNSSRVCHAKDQYSLFCALYEAQMSLTGRYDHRLPAIQHVRFAIDDLYSSRWSNHRLTEFNGHPDTGHDDVVHVLEVAANAIQNKLVRDQ